MFFNITCLYLYVYIPANYFMMIYVLNILRYMSMDHDDNYDESNDAYAFKMNETDK